LRTVLHRPHFQPRLRTVPQKTPSSTAARTRATMTTRIRRPQVCVLGSAEPGSNAYERAAQAGALLAKLGITVVSGCGSPATRVAAEHAIRAGGLVISIVPPDHMPESDWPATVVIPCWHGRRTEPSHWPSPETHASSSADEPEPFRRCAWHGCTAGRCSRS